MLAGGVELAFLVAARPVSAVLAELGRGRRWPVSGVRLDRCGVSAFVPGAADDALCPRLVLLGRADARTAFARDIGARRDEVFAPLASAGVCGMRGPGVAVVVHAETAAERKRVELLSRLLRVQGFDVVYAGTSEAWLAARSHLERFRRERGGQLEIGGMA